MLSSSGGQSFDALLAAPFQLAPGKASSVVKTANVKHVTVVLSETFLQARASTCYNNIRQVQTLPFVSAQGLKDVVPEKAHTRFRGTNRGNAIAFVERLPISEAWTAEFRRKHNNAWEQARLIRRC